MKKIAIKLTLFLALTVFVLSTHVINLRAAPVTTTFNPVADTYVQSDNPTVNYGSSTQIRVDGSPIVRSYLRFDVQTQSSITAATLRIYANSNHNLGFSVFNVVDNTWQELTLNYSNQPAYDSTVIDSSGPLVGGSWYEVDVTPVVNTSGLVSFALTTSSTTAMSLASRESSNKPSLIVETQATSTPSPTPTFLPTASPTLTPSPSPNPTPTPTPTSNPSPGPAKTFTFTAVGDIGGNTRSNATLSTMANLNVDFNLALGDLSYSEKLPESAWCDYVKSYVGPNFPFELVAGNHEEDSGPDGHIDNFAPCLPDKLNSIGTYAKEYYFDYPQTSPLVRFIMISADLTLNSNSYNYNVGSTHYTWLANTIDQAKSAGIKWIVVGMHEVCITTGVKDCSVGTDLMNLLLEKKVDLVFQGHDHNYQRSKQLALSANCTSLVTGAFDQDCVTDEGSSGMFTKGQGTIVVITGTGGRGTTSPDPSDPEAPYFATWVEPSTQVNGFTKVAVAENDLTINFVPSVGTYSDSFNIINGGSTPMPSDSPIPSPTITPSPSPTPSSTPAPSTLVFIPLEDAHVRLDKPSNNYGTGVSLEVDGNPTKRSLLKFSVTGVETRTVTNAKLRLYNLDSSNSGGSLKTVSNLWSESSLTWNNAPVAHPGVLGTIGAVSPGNWYDIDLTGFITADGEYAFDISSSASNGADYSSSEGVNPPRLEIQTN